MNIFIICSKRFYNRIPPIMNTLEDAGHSVVLPNSYNNPSEETKRKEQSSAEHARWKGEMFRLSAKKIETVEAVLVLNFEKDGQQNYIGGATFIEMYDAFRLSKKIFLYNDIPQGILYDEILGFSPICISGDLAMVA